MVKNVVAVLREAGAAALCVGELTTPSVCVYIYKKGCKKKGNWLERAMTEEKSLECKPCRDRQPFSTLGTLVVVLDEQSQSEARGEALGRPSSFAVPSSGENAKHKKRNKSFCQSSRKVTVHQPAGMFVIEFRTDRKSVV